MIIIMKVVLDNVTKKIGPSIIIDQINLELCNENVYGFQGINGCGKTMLMRLIAGLIYPTEGKVLVDGKVLRGENSFPDSMGLLIENPAFLGGYSGLQNLNLLAEINNRITFQDVKETLSRVGLDPEDKKKYKKYSLGMKQRLGIACAIMERPEIIILDEPFISLDEAGVDMLKGIIKEERERGALIILACHDYDILADLADEIFRITAGRITKHLKKIGDDFSEV